MAGGSNTAPGMLITALDLSQPTQHNQTRTTVPNSEKEHQRHSDRSGEPSRLLVARPSGNTTLLARYCKDKVPRTCDHAILQNTSRPCSLGESFVSSGSSLTIEMRMVESTALRRVQLDRGHRAAKCAGGGSMEKKWFPFQLQAPSPTLRVAFCSTCVSRYRSTHRAITLSPHRACKEIFHGKRHPCTFKRTSRKSKGEEPFAT